MAQKHIANKETKWRVVNTTPDFCRVGTSVVPFDIFRDLSNAITYSPNVYARGVPVLTVTSRIKGVVGDTGSGVASQVSMGSGDVIITSGSTTVNTNKLQTAYNTSDCLMNVGGAPNCFGKVITEQGAPAGEIKNNKPPCNDQPKTSPRLEELRKRSEKLKSDDPRELLDFIRTSESEEIVQGGIGQIRTTQPGLLHDAAGMARGALGVVNRFVFGLANLAKMAAQQLVSSPFIDEMRRQTDHEVLAENIRLGNCTDQRSLWEKIKDAAKQTVKPVSEPWSQGEYSESVIAATGEILMLLLPVGEAGEASKAEKVVQEVAEGASKTEARAARVLEEGTRAPKPVLEPRSVPDPPRLPKPSEPVPTVPEPPAVQEPLHEVPSRPASPTRPEPNVETGPGKAGEAAERPGAGSEAPKSEPTTTEVTGSGAEDGVQVQKRSTNHQKAEFGEKTADAKMKELGYEPVKVKSGHYTPGETGIDGIYRNPKYPPTPPEYVITEAKYNTAKLGKTADGRQMSQRWLLSSKRLEKAVGPREAARIRAAIKGKRVEKLLLRVDEKGNVTAKVLDKLGKKTSLSPTKWK